MSDSFCAFKFHSTSPKSTNTSPATPRMATISSRSHPCCICTQCTQLLTLNQHLAHAGEQGTSSAGGFHVNSQQTSRWSPTPAQLLVLEELYRQGTRTPTAEQIQQIASQLRRFGKIEGKNVFYWFQNHKARERQKRRRREMETTAAAAAAAEEKDQCIMRSSEKQQEAAGLRTTGDEVKETKKWASTSNYCNRLTEESASLDIAEREANGWTQFKEREAKCQNIHMISCSLPNLCRNTSTTTATSVATTHRTPTISRYYNLPFILNTENIDNYDDDDEELNDKDNRTLELFPLRRDSQDGVCHTEGNNSKFCNISASINSTEMNCNQFFEFLPLKD